MFQIRKGVFETNSSSTHSITMCSKEEFEGWKDGELLFNTLTDTFITKEEAIERLKQIFGDKNSGDLADTLDEYDWYSYNRYFYNSDLETFEATHVTKKGEVVVAFGKFGFDG